MTTFEKISPLYTVYYYTDFLYRVVKFKRGSDGIRLSDQDGDGPQERFVQSYCRSRSMVLQYALCNHWDYFITITVSPEKFDRWDLNEIYRSLSQWFRDFRKLYGGVRYVLVPEHHKDGAWHFHGLIADIPSEFLSPFVRGIHPDKLVDAGYLNFGLLAEHIGYVSLGKLRDPVGAAFYVVKYITKEHAHDDFYQHLYFCTRGLNRARPVADCYSSNPTLDECLEFECDFCSCGWARDKDWTFAASPDLEPRQLADLVPVPEELLISDPEFIQLSIVDWLEFEQRQKK